MARERQKSDKKESRKQTKNETKRERESSGYAKKDTGETHTEESTRQKMKETGKNRLQKDENKENRGFI